ncbi:uncharacterized protein LOC135951544 [Calliphora vicina]|uniref:uncharacterized protein LOC135951544 n=1 Tax=Calliphora vicina TaxID=7373 RepID=UPI00325BB409
MSEIDTDDFKAKYKPNATTITNKALKYFPNVKHFFEILLQNTNITTKHVGRSFQYNPNVERYFYFKAHGVFMDYFIRKHLSNKYNIKITVSRTEYILENPDNYTMAKNETLWDSIKEHYEIFKDSNTQAMDIIESIKFVAFSHLIYFEEPIPVHEYTVNEDNLREIIRYFERLPYKTVELHQNLGCDYFSAHADIIFDDDVIYEIKTSKFKSLTYDKPKIQLSKFYQTIIYGFGLYKNTGIKLKKFKIYNPLLGDEFSIELDNIDFELFEKVLKRDVAVFSRWREILNDEMILNLLLFSGEEDQK